MHTQYAAGIDGRPIAFDVCGSGPGLLLLHGAGKTRSDWHTAGYVGRLSEQLTVVTVDTRGQGESGFLTDEQDFAIELIVSDFLRVADSCGLERFHICGYSFGGGIARYLSARSSRIISSVIVGAPFTHATDAQMKPLFEGLLTKWEPIVNGYRDGTLSAEELSRAKAGRIPVWSACFQAMRTWPKVAPSQILCPTLLLYGTRNEQVVDWLKDNKESLTGTRVVVEYLEGLDHEGEFSAIDKSLPPILAFFKRSGPT